jgi:hypothetical protein
MSALAEEQVPFAPFTELLYPPPLPPVAEINTAPPWGPKLLVPPADPAALLLPAPPPPTVIV